MNEHIMGEADKISEKGPDVDTFCADLWSENLHRKKATPEDPKENPLYLAGYRAGVEAGRAERDKLRALLREARVIANDCHAAAYDGLSGETWQRYSEVHAALESLLDAALEEKP